MSRPARNAEFAALLALRAAVDLKFLGCRFGRGLTGSICVSVGGEAAGAWWFEDDTYRFARLAYQAPSLVAIDCAQVIEMTNAIAMAQVAGAAALD